jgi:hypothetical protein
MLAGTRQLMLANMKHALHLNNRLQGNIRAFANADEPMTKQKYARAPRTKMLTKKDEEILGLLQPKHY